MKKSYFIVPLITLIIAYSGSWLTNKGMDWYKTIKLPDFTPSGSIIGTAWTIIFILTAISAIIVWNKAEHNSKFYWIIILFLINGFLNIFWSYLFFYNHSIGLAVLEAGLLGLSVLILIILIKPINRLSSVLLYPYLIWVIFATYLTYAVWSLNK